MPYASLDIRNWIMDIHDWIMDIRNWIIGIHIRIKDIHGINNWFMDGFDQRIKID